MQWWDYDSSGPPTPIKNVQNRRSHAATLFLPAAQLPMPVHVYWTPERAVLCGRGVLCVTGSEVRTSRLAIAPCTAGLVCPATSYKL
jgi:hypothetical protein